MIGFLPKQFGGYSWILLCYIMLIFGLCYVDITLLSWNSKIIASSITQGSKVLFLSEFARVQKFPNTVTLESVHTLTTIHTRRTSFCFCSHLDNNKFWDHSKYCHLQKLPFAIKSTQMLCPGVVVK